MTNQCRILQGKESWYDCEKDGKRKQQEVRSENCRGQFAKPLKLYKHLKCDLSCMITLLLFGIIWCKINKDVYWLVRMPLKHSETHGRIGSLQGQSRWEITVLWIGHKWNRMITLRKYLKKYPPKFAVEMDLAFKWTKK